MTDQGVYILAGLVVLGFNIALFVKVWKMTNDVRKLRNHFTWPPSEHKDFEIRKSLLMGDKEKAKGIILNDFIARVSNTQSDEPGKFKKLKEKFVADLAKIGCEVPEGVDKLQSSRDFFNLFES